MPLDISLDDIELYIAYRVNRIGRGCIAYRIILYSKLNTYVIGKIIYILYIYIPIRKKIIQRIDQNVFDIKNIFDFFIQCLL